MSAMTVMRSHCTPAELAAHALLDQVRSGIDVPAKAIDWALRVLGEKA